MVQGARRVQLIRRRGFSSGTRSAGFQACPCFSDFPRSRRHLPRALLRLKRRAGRDFMDRRAKAESLRPHLPHEKCEQGGTPDDVRTVKRRKRRAPNSSRAARLSACGRSPPAAVPHLRQRQKFAAPRLRCCRCGREGRAPVWLRPRRSVLQLGKILVCPEEFGARHLCRFSVRSASRVGPPTTFER